MDQTLPGWATENGRPSLEMCSNKSRYILRRPRSHFRRLLYDPRCLGSFHIIGLRQRWLKHKETQKELGACNSAPSNNMNMSLENRQRKGLPILADLAQLDLVEKATLLRSVMFGTLTVSSFTKDGSLYQIAKLPPSTPPILVPSTSETSRPGPLALGVKLTITLGGTFRIGCTNSNASVQGSILICDKCTS